MDRFYIKLAEDRQQGPLSQEEIVKLIREGSLTPEDSVRQESQNGWRRAIEFEALSALFEQAPKPTCQPKIYAIASGKGGVGKTVLTGSIGVGLASVGQDVILIDADFGGANLHTSLGMLQPERTFFDYYTLQTDSLTDIILDTPVSNLRLISGACGTLGLANQKYTQKMRFMNELRTLPADSVILDLGAGSSYDIIDFFLLADEKILVISPEPTSVYEAFGFIKVCLLRQLKRTFRSHKRIQRFFELYEISKPGKKSLTMQEIIAKLHGLDPAKAQTARELLSRFTPRLILNMVKSRDDIQEGRAIQTALIELLSVRAEYLGYISYDPQVGSAVKAMQPFLLHNARSKASRDLAKIIRVNLLGQKGIKQLLERHRWQQRMSQTVQHYPQPKAAQNEVICSVNCFYWDNCDYQDGGHPCRVRHIEPTLKDFFKEKQST